MSNRFKTIIALILISLSAFGVPSLFIEDALTIWGALGIISTLLLLMALLNGVDLNAIMSNRLKTIITLILINLSAFGIPSLFIEDTLTRWGILGIISTLLLLVALLKYRQNKKRYEAELAQYYRAKAEQESSWIPLWIRSLFTTIPELTPPVKPRALLVGSPTTIATYGTGVAISIAGKSAPAIMTVATKLPWGTALAKLVGTGTGGAEIASGLATLGKLVGGGMGAGAVISATAPLVASVALAWGITKIIEKVNE